MFIVFISKYDPKSIHFSILQFCENRAPVEAKLLFFRLRGPYNRLKIDAEINLEKNIEKNIGNIDLGTISGSQNPPKIPPRSEQIAFKVEPKKKLQPPNEPSARLNALHPANQAQKDSYKSSIYLSI